jgi:hypothetical protein
MRVKRIAVLTAAFLSVLSAAAPGVCGSTKAKVDAGREQCQAAYDRAASAALLLYLTRGDFTADRRQVYSDISSQLSNTPYVAADAVTLFCDASTLSRVAIDTAAMERHRATLAIAADPSTAKLHALKSQLDALPAVK